jgi:WD40 repeat protein
MESLTPIFTYHTSHELILCIALTKNNKYILSGANDGCVGVWDLAAKVQYHMFSGIQYEAIHSLTSSPDNKFIITGGADRSVVVLDIEKKEKVYAFLEVHQSKI